MNLTLAITSGVTAIWGALLFSTVFGLRTMIEHARVTLARPRV
jgi:hypothetical protein